MTQRVFGSVIFACLVQATASVGGEPAVQFADGRWSGGMQTAPDRPDVSECWASTVFADGATLTLAKHADADWSLRLSNPRWNLPPSRRYDMLALVDFYPRLRITAEARSGTILEIASLEQISLLGIIENGHTITLTSDGFNEKFDLEGSAKIISWVKDCFAHHLAAERPAK